MKSEFFEKRLDNLSLLSFAAQFEPNLGARKLGLLLQTILNGAEEESMRSYEILSNLQKSSFAEAEQEKVLARSKGAQLITYFDPEYPEQLRQIPDPPISFFLKGKIPNCKNLVAVVGSRRATEYGKRIARKTAYELCLRGLGVVSGLAYGIDSEAHLGSVEAARKSKEVSGIAVLGSGLANIYPRPHLKLAEQILDTDGAIISEYPMNTPPMPQNFPRRNRIISGLAKAVLVVEGAKKSGSLITARTALEQDREVFAVPGPLSSPNSIAVNGLIKQGARLFESVEDFAEFFPAKKESINCRNKVEDLSNEILDQDQKQIVNSILELLEIETVLHLDQIQEKVGVSFSELSAILSVIEAEGVIERQAALISLNITGT